MFFKPPEDSGRRAARVWLRSWSCSPPDGVNERGERVVDGGVEDDEMLKTLKHARLDDGFEAELSKLIAGDVLKVGEFRHRRDGRHRGPRRARVGARAPPLGLDAHRVQPRARRLDGGYSLR